VGTNKIIIFKKFKEQFHLKTFKQYLIEQKKQQLDNWQDLLAENEMLRIGVELLGKIESLEPSSEALIVGGSCRDILLGKKPKDIDIAGNVPIKIIKKYFRTADIGQSADFGITAILYKGFVYEYATYRSDIF